jgi:hypothetical protein
MVVVAFFFKDLCKRECTIRYKFQPIKNMYSITLIIFMKQKKSMACMHRYRMIHVLQHSALFSYY